MDENKKSKATGISIGLILIIVFVGFGFLIALTQLKSTKNLGAKQDASPYADFCFNESGALVYYSGEETEVTIPETYSLSPTAVTKTIKGTSLTNLENKANRLGLKNYNISVQSETISDGYSTMTAVTYTLTFKGFEAQLGADYTTKEIASYAFQDNQTIKKVVLPETIQSIGAYAFSYCTALNEINLPDSINNIGDWAFQNCDGLTEVTLPANLMTLQNGVFQECSKLQKVTMQDGIRNIWSQAFYNCRKLEEITFSVNLQSIDMNAFYYCTGLKTISLPSSISYIASRVFWGCSGLECVIIESYSPPQAEYETFTITNKLKFYVMDEAYDSYLYSYPWNNYSGYLYRLSELQSA